MITNKHTLNEFYRKLIEQESLSHKEALAIYEALHEEALCSGAINSENILEGLETDLRIARAINGLSS
jgi:restriction endonuclease